MKKSSVETVKEIFKEKYPDSMFILLAGSIVRGEETKTSDLDLVVVYKNIECAYRDSYYWASYPVEAFVHSLETLEYFFELDKQTGIPSLPSMVIEGIEISNKNDSSMEAKAMAQKLIQEGPPTWKSEEVDRSRYAITDMIEDIKDPRSVNELYATASELYGSLANYYFRSQNLWSAKGKSIPRKLEEIDADFAKLFVQAFNSLFSSGDTLKVIELSKNVLEKEGGFLFSGYKLRAPVEWKVTK